MSEKNQSSIEQVKRLYWFDFFGLAGSVTAFFVARLAMHNTTLAMNVFETLLTYAFIWLCIKWPGKTFGSGIPKYVLGPTLASLVISFLISKAFGINTLSPFMGIISITPLIVGIIGSMLGITTLSKNKVARSFSVIFLLIAMGFEYGAVANITQGSLEMKLLGNPESNTINLVFAEIWLAQVFAYQALMVVCRFPIRSKIVAQESRNEDLAA